MMSGTLEGVSPPPGKPAEPDEEPPRRPESDEPEVEPQRPLSAAELASIEDLVRQARGQGVALTGPGGLLKALTKTVLEAALDEEMAEHLGYDKHQGPKAGGNIRNGAE